MKKALIAIVCILATIGFNQEEALASTVINLQTLLPDPDVETTAPTRTVETVDNGIVITYTF